MDREKADKLINIFLLRHRPSDIQPVYNFNNKIMEIIKGKHLFPRETSIAKELMKNLKGINSSLDSLISSIEKKYDLKNEKKYRVRTYGGEVLDVYYIRSDVYYGTWNKELDIYIRFYKSKKDGEKSKVKNGFSLKEVQDITPCPF